MLRSAATAADCATSYMSPGPTDVCPSVAVMPAAAALPASVIPLNAPAPAVFRASANCTPAWFQGLTLAHFKAQLEHFVWDRGCA